ncbi:SDR family oxidoreductase [Fulvivirga sp. M361]|uniref:SDR family oxidoreductase n=1 Tax=Fulvivirga sp. M361 TaxID=2594266 RepID=UPI00117A58FE|nr:SDR family oxidoreductase [Fulvivirga sp. M361]TRX58300.1 SDR family oxidoreductase [Fulvivirga sp. M361]
MDGMLKEGSFENKTIIVTGGGTGLGRAMGEYLLKLGANLVITSRKIEVLEKAAEEMTSKSEGQVLPIPCDIRKYDEIENVLSEAESKFGKIDGVLNNAAGNFISPTERLSNRAFDIVIDIVLRGTSNFTLAAGKNWIAKKQAGVFLNIVTTYAWTGSGYVVPSACAKAGVLAMTRSLAVEWAKYNIRSNAIAPGPFPTEGAWKRLFPKEVADQIDPIKRIPVRRFGEHQELANLAAYLMSDYAAYVNGEVVTIDGGEWLQGGGEFNGLEAITPEMWDVLEKMRSKK